MTDLLVRCTASALRIRDRPEGEDSGLRALHGQVFPAYGDSWNGSWTWVEAPAGSGWVASRYIDPVEDARGEPDPAWPPVPHGVDEIRDLYGEHGNPAASAGEVAFPAPLPLSWAPEVRVRRFFGHELLVPVYQFVFAELDRRGLWQLFEDFGGCYELRKKRGTSAKWSTHSWGIAVDFNTRSNPLGRAPTMDSRIVAVFEDAGFTWGGRWSRPDGMHFQRAAGY